jgi:hypothetical protein
MVSIHLLFLGTISNESCLDRWKPLEALLAILGTHSETILETLENEESEERPKPIHVDAMIKEIVPQLASATGMD